MSDAPSPDHIRALSRLSRDLGRVEAAVDSLRLGFADTKEGRDRLAGLLATIRDSLAEQVDKMLREVDGEDA